MRFLNLEATLECGQVFHWTRSGEGYVGLIGDTAVYLEESNAELRTSKGHEALAHDYLGLDHDLQAILGSFSPNDAALNAAIRAYEGMRLVKQPEWECLATFLTSAQKTIPMIRKISLRLRERYGEPRTIGPETLYTYPKPETLVHAGVEALRECGLGFRAKWVFAAAEAVTTGTVNLDAVSKLDTLEARKALCQIHGVGNKIADCTLLFGFARLDAFPIDVWVERVLKELYFPPKRGRRKPTKETIESFAQDYFGEYRGYAQQYLFHYARNHYTRSGGFDFSTTAG